MCKYLLDLIGINLDEPLVGYEDSKLKLSITIIFQNLTLPWDEKERYWFFLYFDNETSKQQIPASLKFPFPE